MPGRSATAFDRIQKLVPISAMANSTGTFASVETLPPDAIFHVKARYAADEFPEKVNLGIGAYRDDDGKPVVLDVVRKMEAEMLSDPALNKEYLPISGDKTFVGLAQGLILGRESPALNEGRCAGVQTLSGTGALRVIAEFLNNSYPDRTVYLSNPTWGNHKKVLKKAGFSFAQYAYFHAETRGLDFEGLTRDLTAAPDGSIVLLHACAHNPTGVDPSMDQWMAIADIVERKRMIPWFDSAYQGFATGDLAGDAAAVRAFENRGLEMVISQSFAKNMGLYGERCGCATVLCLERESAAACQTQLNAVIRPMYSNPPKHGMEIAKRILGSEEYMAEWQQELQVMSGRILAMRTALRQELESSPDGTEWRHITDQIGMFSFTGLTPEQSARMADVHHVYMLSNGRISMAGVNTKNVGRVAQAMKECIQNA